MGVRLSTQGDKMILLVEGRFDFAMHYEFRKCTEEGLSKQNLRTIDVDLSKVDYVDSSALGMLLVLLEKAKAAGKGQITLKGAHGMVKQVLDVANFDRMFKLA